MRDVIKLVIDYDDADALVRLDDRIQAAVDNSKLPVDIYRTYDMEVQNDRDNKNG